MAALDSPRRPAQRWAEHENLLVREIAKFGGDVSPFVHPLVYARLKAKVTGGR